MAFPGVKDPGKLGDLLAYLKIKRRDKPAHVRVQRMPAKVLARKDPMVRHDADQARVVTGGDDPGPVGSIDSAPDPCGPRDCRLSAGMCPSCLSTA